MARIRTIKPEFWTDEAVVECSPTARLLFIGLWNFADDNGAHQYSPKTIKMEIFPGDDFTIKQIEKWLDELKSTELIRTYHVEDKQYLLITGWHNQKIEKPNPKHPIPQSFDDQSTTVPQLIPDSSPPEGKGRESKGRDSKGLKRKTPLPDDFAISDNVKAWASKKGHSRLPEHLESFKSKCKANGYQYVDWDAAFMEAIRNDWARLSQQHNGNGNGNRGYPAPVDHRPTPPEWQGDDLPTISDEERARNLARLKGMAGAIGGAP